MNAGNIERFFRPLPCPAGTAQSRPLAGGPLYYSQINVLSREGAARSLPVDAVEALYPAAKAAVKVISAERPAVCGVTMDRPRVLGIVNVTPDSFSDGGQFGGTEDAIAHGMALVAQGADMLDVGGESTRPGAARVSPQEEIDRVLPVIEGLRAEGCPAPISIDTRNAIVARAARKAGAGMFNDVSALGHDPDSLSEAAHFDAICLMHAQGSPETMQHNPAYDDVVMDVYSALAERVGQCEAAGIPRARIVVDPGIGFGKTTAHNLALIRNLSLFHGLGCVVMLGVSRKGFIGRLSGEGTAAKRAPGSITAGLAGLAEGVQILRVHDVAETAQAIAVWRAIHTEEA